MNQIVKFVKIQQSYVPSDPLVFPETLFMDAREEEGAVPVMAYAGKNFLPTYYGYKSFFGINDLMEPPPLTDESVHQIFVFQNSIKENYYIALTASGVLAYKAGSGELQWNLVIDTSAYPSGCFWTYCLLQNEIYIYRKGLPYIIKVASSGAPGGYALSAAYYAGNPAGLFLTEETPTFLSMGAQVGIFTAGNRLGIWDNTNSVAWSSIDNPMDFTPSLSTLAGSAKFAKVQGDIVNILPHGEDFVIYATKSVVHVRHAPSTPMLWAAIRILTDTGITYPEEVVKGVPDSTHFAWTHSGMYKVTNGNVEQAIPEVTDYLRTYASPRYLKLMDGRYLVFEIVDSSIAQNSKPFEQIEGIAMAYAMKQGSPLSSGAFSEVTQAPSNLSSSLGGGIPHDCYSTRYGAYVFDTRLEKWGKLDQTYKVLVDYRAINNFQTTLRSQTVDGPYSGILNAAGELRVFTDTPQISYMVYGKVGYYRQGTTSVEEIRIHHRKAKAGWVAMQTSMEGKVPESQYTTTETFDSSGFWIKYGDIAGRWHNIIIGGQYDINYVEFRGITQGKR